jgi:hypothetical protein
LNGNIFDEEILGTQSNKTGEDLIIWFYKVEFTIILYVSQYLQGFRYNMVS